MGGDVAIVGLSPDDLDDYEEFFTKLDLKKNIDCYKTANSEEVSEPRERSRLSRKGVCRRTF